MVVAPKASVVGLLIAAAVYSSAILGQPRIDSLSPAEGPIAGGTIVTIRGSDLATATFRIDEVLVTPNSQSQVEVRLRMPAHDHGYALIEAANTAGTAHAHYLYLAPALTDLPPGHITTVGGVGTFIPYYRPAASVPLLAGGLDVDSIGAIYTAVAFQHIIVRVDPDGVLRPVAGTGSYNPDLPIGDGGDARKAQILFPRLPSLDAGGNIYVAAGERVRRIDATTRIITTVAGTGVRGFSGDGGPATEAQLDDPSWVEATPDGTLFILDSNNSRVRKVSTEGVITTIAGTGVPGQAGDGGPATAAQIEGRDSDAGGLAFDPAGYLYLVQTWNDRVRRIDLNSGIITTFVFSGVAGRPLDHPRSATVDPQGNVFVGADRFICKFDRGGSLLAAWGSEERGFVPDGSPVTDLKLVGDATGIAVESDGSILYSDGGRIRRLHATRGVVETVAGIAPEPFGIPGRAVAMPFASTEGDLALLPSGDLLFTNLGLYRIVRMSNGWVHKFAGNGFIGGFPSPRASESSFGDVVAMEVDPEGGVYLTNSGPIQRITPDGLVEHIAGQGDGYSGDGGPAASASFLQPWDVTLDDEGNLFVADTNNNRIRRIDAKTKIVSSVAGGNPPNGYEEFGEGSYCGDGGPATEACLNTPFGVAVDGAGRIFIGDFYNHRIRVVEGTTIRTFAEETSGRLIATPSGTIIANAFWWIYRYQPDGRRFTIAGKGDRGFSGDGGPAANAMIDTSGVSGLAVDREGNLFFVDGHNRRIRAVRFGAVLAPVDATVHATVQADTVHVTVRDAAAKPLAGIRVDFTVPPSGATCRLSDSFTITGSDGRASIRCASNCVGGTYDLTATLIGSPSSAKVTIHNADTPCRRRPARR